MKKILITLTTIAVMFVGVAFTNTSKAEAYSGWSYTNNYGTTDYYFGDGTTGWSYTNPYGSTDYYFSDGTTGWSYSNNYGTTDYYFNNSNWNY